MRKTTNFDLNIVEGTDLVNSLVQDVPNYEKIDEVMADNMLNSIPIADITKEATTHAITRRNTKVNLFRFTANGDFQNGDVITVDNNVVSPYMANGLPLPNNAFLTNSTVVCILDNNRLTLLTYAPTEEVKKENKVIVIGDSYGTINGGGVTVTPYPERMKNITGLGDNLLYYTRNGTGFANSGFLNNLKALSVEDKELVTDIYVFGGWNDSADKITNAQDVEDNITIFSTYAKATYPNAKLHLGFLAYGNSTSKNLMNLIQPYKVYKNCQDYGFDTFVNGSESICANRNPKWWASSSSQGVFHPSDALEEKIANYLSGYVKTGDLSYADISTLTLTGIDTVTTSAPNAITQRVVDNVLYTEFTQRVNVQTSSAFNINQNSYKALFDLTNNIAVGLVNNLNGVGLASIYVGSSWSNIPIFWKIENNQFLVSAGQTTVQNINGMYINCATATNNIIEN